MKKLGKKNIYKILGVLVVGVMLLLISSMLKDLDQDPINKTPEPEDLTQQVNLDQELEERVPYELEMEQRLQSILKKMQGVGQVEVMITTTYGKEIILAQDITSNTSSTTEEDKEGGTRKVSNYDDQAKVVMQNSNGSSGNQPIVVKEKQPEIQGVLIIAEGANKSLVKQSITQSAQTLLGVSPHRVTVHQLETVKK